MMLAVRGMLLSVARVVACHHRLSAKHQRAENQARKECRFHD
jgi:hypothetical protein